MLRLFYEVIISLIGGFREENRPLQHLLEYVVFLPSVQSNCNLRSTVELLRMVFLCATLRANEDVWSSESIKKPDVWWK